MTPRSMARDGDYLLGYSEAEATRLERQAAFLADLTEGVLRRAGLAPGMNVLDVGCGMGDVSLIAARIVGPTGSVTGIDRNGAGFARAAARIQAEGLGPSTFVSGEIGAYAPAKPFDAVIGRLVLMYFPDPAAALRDLCRHLSPGGIVAFQEIALSTSRSVPPLPLFDDNIARLVSVYAKAGLHGDMGLALDRAFRDAGLVPELSAASRLDGNGEGFCPTWIAQTVASLVPMMEKTGVATAQEIGAETLESRLRAECAAAGTLIVAPLMIGATARLP